MVPLNFAWFCPLLVTVDIVPHMGPDVCSNFNIHILGHLQNVSIRNYLVVHV